MHVAEIADDENPAILRAYLKAWAWEVNQFFGGLGDGPAYQRPGRRR